MSTESTVIICLTAATLIVSSLGIWFGWIWHKAIKRQSLEQELAQIEADIKEIDAQQAEAEARGRAEMQHIYSANVQPNPYGGVSFMLELKKRTLIERRAKIITQLKQL